MSTHLFLSPHPDDVPLSCGGLLTQLAQQGESLSVINIFAGLPDPQLKFSDFAQYQHQMWGDLSSAYQSRRLEEQTALAHFQLEPIWLDFLDCIYRGDPAYYNSDPDIFGPLHPAETDLIPQIAAAIHAQNPASPAETRLYAPLRLGNHVDHQLTHRAAWHLHQQGYALHFYEDYPYAHRQPADFLRVLAGQNWACRLIPLTQSDLQTKIAAIAAYQSQMQILFGGESQMRQDVQTYARQVGHTQPAERLWTPQTPSK